MTMNDPGSLVASFLIALLFVLPQPADGAQCSDDGIVLQVLGSAGPFGSGRASAGYIVWVDGVSRIMVDAGGGTFLRFHEAGASVENIDLLALSHFHPDHSAEVPALFWIRQPELVISGPSGSKQFASLDEYLDAQFRSPDAAFRIIGTYLEAHTVTVDVESTEPAEIYSDDDITVRGIGVPHGIVPTVGYRVDIGDKSIAFSSDQVGTNEHWLALIADVDVLVVHFAVNEETNSSLHAKPSVWGKMAAHANAGSVVLSHISESAPDHPAYASTSGADLESNVAHFKSNYDGETIVAEDLLCVPLH